MWYYQNKKSKVKESLNPTALTTIFKTMAI